MNEDTKTDLIERWNGAVCTLSTGESLKLLLTASIRKAELERQIEEFCDRALADIKSSISSHSFWNALEHDEQVERLHRLGYQFRSGLIYTMTPHRSKETSTQQIARDCLNNAKLCWTRKQSEAMYEQGYFTRAYRDSFHNAKQSKIVGFCFVDLETGDRYLTTGADPKSGTCVSPNGRIKEGVTLPSEAKIYIEDIRAYFVQGDVGVEMELVGGGSKLLIDVFPLLDAINNGHPEPFWFGTRISVEVQPVRKDRFYVHREGERKFSFSSSSTSIVSMSEYDRITFGQNLAISIAEDFDNFLDCPKTWLEYALEEPD